MGLDFAAVDFVVVGFAVVVVDFVVAAAAAAAVVEDWGEEGFEAKD